MVVFFSRFPTQQMRTSNWWSRTISTRFAVHTIRCSADHVLGTDFLGLVNSGQIMQSATFFLPNCWAKEWYAVLWAVWWTRALCSGRSQHWESRSGLQLVQDVGKQGGMGRGALGPCTALRWRSLSDIWDDWGGPVSGSGSGSKIDDWKLQAVATQLRTELR